MRSLLLLQEVKWENTNGSYRLAARLIPVGLHTLPGQVLSKSYDPDTRVGPTVKQDGEGERGLDKAV